MIEAVYNRLNPYKEEDGVSVNISDLYKSFAKVLRPRNTSAALFVKFILSCMSFYGPEILLLLCGFIRPGGPGWCFVFIVTLKIKADEILQLTEEMASSPSNPS